MGQPNPTQTVTNPRIAKLIELETAGRIKPGHQTELDTYRAQGLAPKKTSGNTLTEYQGKSTGFYERAVGANKDFEGAGEGGSPVGVMGDVARDVLPANVVNSFTSADRQKAQQAKEDFIRASLRYESGAAIGQAEFDGQEKIFFPQTGDSEDVIRQKAEARQRVIESLKVAAGPGVAGRQAEAAPTKTLLDGGDVGETIATAVDGARKYEDGDYTSAQKLPNGSWELTYPDGSKVVRKDMPPLAVDVHGDAGASPEEIEKARDTTGGEIDAVGRGMADTLSLGFADEAAALGDTVFKGGTFRDNIDHQRAIDAADAEVNPWARAGGQITGGLLFPLGRGATAPGELAKIGGLTGAGYGFGSGDSLGERLGGAVVGAPAGAATGYLGGKLFQRLGKGGAGPDSPGSGVVDTARDVAQASADLGVDMLPADAGGPLTRTLTTVARTTPGGAVPITKAAQRSQKQAGDALNKIASREGAVLDAENMGNAVREGAMKFRAGSRNSIGRVYDKAAEEAGDARIAPAKAIETLDRHIAELTEVPGGADGLSVLQGLKDELAKRGTITVNGIRGMRTQLRQKFAKDNLRGSDIERRVNEVVDAASNDLITSLEAQGKSGAARAYAEADRQWADRIKTLDDVIMPIIGKKGEKSGEQIAAALNSAAKGNNARLAKLFETLPEEEAGIARATMIDNLGKAGPGAQNAGGDAFSFNSFLTNWNKMGNSAKNAIFQGENRQAIDQLALLADRAKAASKYQNYSNTGLAVMGAATGGTAVASVFTLGKVLAAQYAAGRLLASPKVAKALLKIAQAKNPAAVNARIEALSSVAAREPILSNEIGQLQQKLLSAMNDNYGAQSAASQEEKKSSKP